MCNYKIVSTKLSYPCCEGVPPNYQKAGGQEGCLPAAGRANTCTPELQDWNYETVFKSIAVHFSELKKEKKKHLASATSEMMLKHLSL